MKPWRVWSVLALLLTAVSPGHAQTASAAAAARPDFSASLGWFNANKGELSSHNNWYNRALHGAATFGWHWSTHLKTELEVSATTEADFFASREEIINARLVYIPAEYDFATRHVSVAQHYQFGENAWFHPNLAAGIDINWETVRRLDRDAYHYDGRQATLVRLTTRHPARTDVHVRPLLSAGFKAYMTPRSFFRSDLRFVVGRRIEDVLLRFGLGVDF